MVKFSYQISNLVIILVALKLLKNEVEAGKISSLSKLQANESSIISEKLPNTSSETFVGSSEAQVESSTINSLALNKNSDDSRASTVYSYFYIGRWAWHIPLWFTLWFVFYIAFNVVRAIYGHSVRILLKSFEN